MDILEAVAIEFPCRVCGDRYEITLKQVLLSQHMLHEGCLVPRHFETECPLPYYAELIGRELIDELRQTWQLLEEKARSVGGSLILMQSTVPGR